MLSTEIKSIEKKYDAQLSTTEKIAKFSLKHPAAYNLAKLGFITGCTVLGAYAGQNLIGNTTIHQPEILAHDEIIRIPIWGLIPMNKNLIPVIIGYNTVTEHIPYQAAHDDIVPAGGILGGVVGGITSSIATYFRKNKDC